MEKRKPRADGLFRVKIYLGKVDGKPKYKYVYGATQKEAEEKAYDVRARMKKGMNVNADETFGTWIDRWLRLKKAEVSNTYYLNCASLAAHFSQVRAIPISKMNTYDIQEIIFELYKENPKTKKPTAKKTLNDIKNAARQIFQLAIDNRVLEYNPALAVKIPKSAPKESRRALTETEKKWILDTPHRMQTAAMIMLYAGLRRGEVIPLLWSDIDFEQRTISVNKSVEMIAAKTVIKDGAKTEAGTRVIDIPEKLIEYLQSADRSKELVCSNLSGRIYTANSWRCSWASYMLELDVRYGRKGEKREDGTEIVCKSRYDSRFKGLTIEPITPHMLRHTFCTMLYFAGVDVLTAQQLMGHADASTTLGIYTHLDKAHKRRQMDKLDEYLSSRH